MDNSKTRLQLFKEESNKSGFDFEFKREEVKIKSVDGGVLQELVFLFKSENGLRFYVTPTVDYLVIEPETTDIRVRSIPHLLKILKVVYKD